GTADQLVHLYQLAYSTAKSTDPNAIVMGPTKAFDDFSLFDAGLGQYIDIFSSHPYMENDAGYDVGHFDPERQGIPSRIATAKRTLASYVGHDLPMVGTEQGYRTRQDPSEEVGQARRMVRSNLIQLGEGWKLNTVFYFADYPSTDDWNQNFYWDWG